MTHRKENRRRLGGIVSLIRRRAHRLFGLRTIKDDAYHRQKMSSSGNYGSEGYNSLTGFGSGGAREPGARRKKLAGYLRAANELRQSYQQSYGSSFNVASSDGSTDHLGNDMPGAFPEAAIVRGRDEEMVIFPSYARNHTKKKQWEAAGPETSGMAPQDPYSMRDPDYWRYQEERYEEEIDAVVDVDVRGWLYSPQKGPMNRKQRLFIGLARQLSGLPAPPTSTISPTTSRSSSRSSSPHTLHRQRMEMRVAKQEEEEVSKEAQAILKRGEKEADIAGRGGFSEFPSNNGGSFADGPSRELSSPSHTRKQEPQPGRIPHPVTETPLTSDSTSPISAADRRQSWTDPAKMSPAELTEANNHLMARLRPFLANPLVDTAVSAFFFNESNSEQRTIPTDTSGHFSIRAALTFVPTHVRLLASEGGLSALQEVHVTQPQGISLISDIDDTIKHSAITAGAKEIFRNTFIRSLDDLTVEGVREWYKRMADMGVKLHYVSNSPWQLYPLLASYFAKAELPKGSFHLKQYAGVLQGIFEPVAERKKSTMDRLLHDFPDRQFILVGDSGEADLEVYTNTVLENPGRILGIFIRDVTTTKRRRFFDSTMGPLRGEYSPGSGTASPNSWQRSSRGLPQTNDEDDPDLRTAIAASLEDVEKQRHRSIGSIQSSHATQSGPQLRPIEKGENRPRLPPRRPTEPPAPPSHQMGPTMGTLIDLSEPELPTNQASSASAKHTGANGSALKKSSSNTSDAELKGSAPLRKTSSPAPPPKPLALRSSNSESSRDTTASTSADHKKPPPPPTSRKPVTSSTSNQPNEAPPLPKRAPNLEGYGAVARQKISDTYQSLPSPALFWSGMGSRSRPSSPDRSPSEHFPPRNMSVSSSRSEAQSKPAPPPPPPPRRAISSYPAAAAQLASKRLSWNSPPASPKLSGVESDPHEPPLSQRERVWRERWMKAKQELEPRGVMLRSWRVGFDAMEDAMGLVERASKELDQTGGTSKAKQVER